MPDNTAGQTGPFSGTRSKRAAERRHRQNQLASAASRPFGTLNILPPETILSIIEYSDVPALVNFRLVNTHCKAFIDETPQYKWLSTTHPVVIRALAVAKATATTCSAVVSELRAPRCSKCGDTAAPRNGEAGPGRVSGLRPKFWSYFYLPTSELICLNCWRVGTNPLRWQILGARGFPYADPALHRDLIPWSAAHLRQRLKDAQHTEKQENLDGYLETIPHIVAPPYIDHETRKPVTSARQTEGLVFCDATAVKQLFNLPRP